MEKCTFIMDYLRVTQGYGKYESDRTDFTSYSHTGSYAVDLGGRDLGEDVAYAPCEVVVKRIYGAYNAVWFESVNQVLCADGKQRKLIFMLLHMNDEDMKKIGIFVGKVFKQGEVFYKEGSASAIGSHIHLEVGEAPFQGTGWQKTTIKDRRGNLVWKINRQLRPHDVFILPPKVVCLDEGGINWYKEDSRDESLQALMAENTALKEKINYLSQVIEKINSIVDTL